MYVTTDGTTPTAASTLVTGRAATGQDGDTEGGGHRSSSSSGVASAAYTYTSGIINTIAGGGIPNGDNIAATSAELNGAFGVAVDASGNLYIADYYNARIRKVTAATGVITTVAGNGTSGFAGDGGPATSAEINHAYGVAVDASGNLYIADTSNNRIRMVTASTGRDHDGGRQRHAGLYGRRQRGHQRGALEPHRRGVRREWQSVHRGFQ